MVHAIAEIIKAKDSDAVDDWLCWMYEQGLDAGAVSALVALLPLRWHRHHEDLARALQELRPRAAVPVLLETALSTAPYSGYDYSDALQRKCCWALADIGGEGAKAALQRLSREGSPYVQQAATRRLDRWELEQHRKAHVTAISP